MLQNMKSFMIDGVSKYFLNFKNQNKYL